MSESWSDLYALGGVRSGVRCRALHPTIVACQCCLPSGHGPTAGYGGILHRYTSSADGRSASWQTGNPSPDACPACGMEMRLNRCGNCGRRRVFAAEEELAAELADTLQAERVRKGR